MKESSSLFSSFNARQLTPEEVADTFVAPAQYTDLCKAEHTLLLGPRGSGKTTLLKMLTDPAIRAWAKKTDREPSRLPFKAVYVPADILWTSQLNDIAHQGLDAKRALALEKAAVTTNIQYSLVETVEQVDETRSDRQRESVTAEQIAQEWALDAFPSFYGLRRALRSRLSTIRSLIAEMQHLPEQAAAHPDLPPFVTTDYWTATSVALEIVENVYTFPRGQRWAFCFDELEISPEWLRHELFDAFRSTNQRLLLKLSASPLQSTEMDHVSALAAQEAQDYRIVKLWYSGPAEASDFCHRLTQSYLNRVLEAPVNPQDVLGRSVFAQDDEGLFGRSLGYQPGSPFWNALQVAYDDDPSLRELLTAWDIDPSHPRDTEESDRDQLLRKVKPVLMLRNEFRVKRPTGRIPKIRSRKMTTLYSGAEALYALSDGNPRWLIGMLSDIEARIDKHGRVSPGAQAKILARTSHRFKALLGMLPQSSRTVNGKQLALVDLLDAVGAHFFDRIVRGPFPVDPVGSFIVDTQATDALVELIEAGVRQGAIVRVDADWHVVRAQARGSRFRLTFMLSPTYRLPLRLYDAVALSACLEGRLPSRPGSSKRAVEITQGDLFEPGQQQ
jgi:hypothetical protein